MEAVISPIILYAMIVLGALGVLLSLPRARANFALPGFLIGATAGGVVLLALASKAVAEGGGGLPNLYFYLFGFVALASGLRMITHPKPVYSALYFIMTILATCGLFLILSAVFMAAALVIIYAGAILITYLFVIMLATQSPTEEMVEEQPVFDRVAREPVLATISGFLLLAMLSTMLAKGVPMLVTPSATNADEILAQFPHDIEKALRHRTTMGDEGGILPTETLARSVNEDGTPGEFVIDVANRTVLVQVDAEGGATRTVAWPEDLELGHVQAVGYELIKGHPGAIEIAGVILLMAMVGSVVLARKHMQIDEDAKRAQAQSLASREGASS
ncbi:MAG: NADH-quinone oxidoreductase subunit J [Phycisphaerales bacterium JB061]